MKTKKSKSKQPDREGFYWVKMCDPVAASCDWEIGYWSKVTGKWCLWGDKDDVASHEEITEVGPYIRSPDDTPESRRRWEKLTAG